MSQELQLAVEQYQLERSLLAARNLCELLIQSMELSEVYANGFELLGQNCLKLDIDNRDIIYSHSTKRPIMCRRLDQGVLYILNRQSLQNIAAREDINVQRLTRQINHVLQLGCVDALAQKEVSEGELYSLCHEQFDHRLKFLLQYVTEHLEDDTAPILAAETYLQIINQIPGRLISVDWEPFRLRFSHRDYHGDVLLNLGTFKLLYKLNQPLAAIQTDSNSCFHIDPKLLKASPWKSVHGLRAINQFLYDQPIPSSGKGSALAKFNCQTVNQELLRLLLS